MEVPYLAGRNVALDDRPGVTPPLIAVASRVFYRMAIDPDVEQRRVAVRDLHAHGESVTDRLVPHAGAGRLRANLSNNG